MTIRRKFTREFKLEAVGRLRAGQSGGEVARALEVNPSDLYRWRRDLDQYGERALGGNGQRRAEEDRTAELERKIGQQALEIDFLKRALQRFEEERRRLRALHGGAGSTSKWKEK